MSRCCPLFNRRHTGRPRGAQRGQAIVESVFGIIIGLIMFLFIAGICVILFFQTAVFMSARQGARLAAVNPQMVTAQGTAVTSVKNGVISFFSGMTGGKTLSAGDISVTGPTGTTVGYRNVTTTVTYALDTGIPLGAFLESMGATGAKAKLDKFNCSATATMRYEE